MIRHLLVATALLPCAAWAIDCTNMRVDLYDAYAVPSKDDPEDLHAFITLKNRDEVPHTLTDVASPGAKVAIMQPYEASTGDNPITLAPLDQVVINPQQVYGFEPNSTYLILKGYRYRPSAGDTIDLIFTFADTCSETIHDVIVKDEP